MFIGIIKVCFEYNPRLESLVSPLPDRVRCQFSANGDGLMRLLHFPLAK